MSGASEGDLRWLGEAVRLAEPLLGTTAENPTVGALVVDEASGTVLGRGVTAKGGRPHAEPQALAEAGARARGATLYCTLEPCAHWGRTPPCVDAVIRAGISRAVIGIADPDPRTAGGSLARLRNAGIETVLAAHMPSQRLHEGFVMRETEGRPFVTLKLAVSADGRIGRRDRAKLPITGAAAREWTHVQRARSDAVMVGGATAEIDDPELTVRLPGLEGRSPLRVILSGARGLDRRLTLIASVTGHRVGVIAVSDRVLDLPPTVEIFRVRGEGARPHLPEALRALCGRGIARLLVEPGATLAEAFLAQGLVDRFALLTSPVTVGPEGVPATAAESMEARLAAAGLAEVDRQSLNGDILRIFERR